MDNQKGHWITTKDGRHLFINEDLIDKQEREIKEQEEMTKNLTAQQSGEHTQSHSWKDALKDNLDFDDWVHENIKNPEFKKWGASREVSMEDVKDLWRTNRAKAELKNVKELSIEDAIQQVRDAIPASVLSGWFRNADSSYKDRLVDSILTNPGTLNAGLNIAYYNYVKTLGLKDSSLTPMSFKQWLVTPQTMYRGEIGKSVVEGDKFMAYTPDKKIADKFAGSKGTVHSIQVRPIDTWGGYQTTGEQEFLVPIKHYRK